MTEPFQGAKKFLGEKFEKIVASNIAIIGIGGVGSWCAEALVRSGVQRLCLIDLDDICLSNL